MEDETGWLESFEIFSGTKETLMNCPYPFYIVSSLKQNAASLILTQLFQQPIEADSPRLFSYSPKDAVRAIQSIFAIEIAI